jgi:hypothetical protein
MELHGEWQGGAMMAQAGLPPKAEETNMDTVTIALARRPARSSHLLMPEGGGVGRRLALDGRCLRTERKVPSQNQYYIAKSIAKNILIRNVDNFIKT